jgi:hypothetical protein
MKHRYLLLVLFIISGMLRAAEVPLQDARKAGITFYLEHATPLHPVDMASLKNASSHLVADNKGATLFYIFSFGEKGFVIVSATDRVKPVLAYSYDGFYDPDDLPPQFVAWTGQYERQIRYAISKNEIPDARVTREWQHLLTGEPDRNFRPEQTRGVEPFTVSKWNQNTWYNESCPADPGGPGGHVYNGCVPTALGQILYYYRWPAQGTGSYTDMDTTYGHLHVNYDSAFYQWDNMKNSISKSNPGISQLLYHLGVACDLVYGPTGSGMYNHKAAYALRTFFKYSPQTQYIFRDSTSIDWDSVMIAHLERKMPLYYAGWSVPNINGHAFVCDGYQDSSYFHFNFGWSGSSDGYYYVDNLIPGGNNFNLAQELIINIFPDTLHYTYPPYCTGPTVLKFKEGSMTDGSGPTSNYLPHSSCDWLIDPQNSEDSISAIKLTFDYLDTNPGDAISVYNGADATAPLLGSYSGTTLPGVITAPGNRMFIHFSSDIGPGLAGWSATYTTTTPTWCNGTTTITADTAEITNGSHGFNYNNNSVCIWKITPEHQDGKPLTLVFRAFDTDTKDSLKIFDLADTHIVLARLAGRYDSTNLPAPVTSQSGTFFIVFQTNSSVTGKGWNFYYPKSTLGTGEKEKRDMITVYPNPATEKFTVRLGSSPDRTADLSLFNAAGSFILQQHLSNTKSGETLTLDPGRLPPGVYFLKVTTDTHTTVKKIIFQ